MDAPFGNIAYRQSKIAQWQDEGQSCGGVAVPRQKANCGVFLWRNSRSCWVEQLQIATVEFASREASIRPCEHGP